MPTVCSLLTTKWASVVARATQTKKAVMEILVTRPRNVFTPGFTWCDLRSCSGAKVNGEPSTGVCGWAANVSVASRPSV